MTTDQPTLAVTGEPLPCPNPWCPKSDPVVERTLRYMGDASPRRVECECGMRGPVKPTDAEAITAWNTRTHSEPRPVAGLREALELRSAVRRILARCEAVEDENSEKLGKDQTEASSGFLRGERSLAKSIRRELHDLTRQALATTSPDPTSLEGGEGVFDHEPLCADPSLGREPSLRKMVRFYYAQHGQSDPDADAAAYIAAHPSTQGV